MFSTSLNELAQLDGLLKVLHAGSIIGIIVAGDVSESGLNPLLQLLLAELSRLT
jgi:hypothetical protein